MRNPGMFEAMNGTSKKRKALYDAMDLARESGEASVDFGFIHLVIRSPDLLIDALIADFIHRALVITTNGTIYLGTITDKDGLYFTPDAIVAAYPKGGSHINYSSIMALVIEEHPRDKE